MGIPKKFRIPAKRKKLIANILFSHLVLPLVYLHFLREMFLFIFKLLILASSYSNVCIFGCSEFFCVCYCVCVCMCVCGCVCVCVCVWCGGGGHGEERGEHFGDKSEDFMQIICNVMTWNVFLQGFRSNKLENWKILFPSGNRGCFRGYITA